MVINATAPTPAPAVTPRIPGSASGLRHTACTVVPATARAAPASSAASTRGYRWSSTYVTAGPERPASQFTTSPPSSHASPASRPTTVTTGTRTTATARTTATNRGDRTVARWVGNCRASRCPRASQTRTTAPNNEVTTPVGTSTPA